MELFIPNKLREKMDEWTFWKRELKRVYDTWSQK